MSKQRLVFETHATTTDNEEGRATGWLPGELSAIGREQAAELGERRRGDGIAAVFCSDLARAVATAQLAFGDRLPVLLDWRLRECDYGSYNGAPAAEMHRTRADFLDVPYPGGESWRQAVDRVAGVLPDLVTRWSGRRVLVIGHLATCWALEERLAGVPLARSLAAPFEWHPGWEYVLR